MSNNALKREIVRKPVTVDKVEVSKFQKEGSLTAHMRQVVEVHSWYQAKQSANSATNSLYDNSDFGEEYQDKPYISPENRVAFILVPEGTSVESVTKKLSMVAPRNAAIKAAMKEEGVTETFDLNPDTLKKIAEEFNTRVERLPEAAHLTDPCIYKVLSNHPILTSSQKYSISIGQKSLDEIANKQAVRYPKEHELAGNLITDSNGKVQYKGTFFSEWHVDDIDLRTKDLQDVYLTKEIRIEIGEGVEAVNDEQYMTAETADSQGQTV